MRFVCTKWGDPVWDEYVPKLERGIARHYSNPYSFECLEGDAGWPRKGCWPKLELFKAGFITGPTTYIDLDSVIVGSLDWLDTMPEYPPGHRRYGLPAPLAMPQFSCKIGQPQACLIQFSGANVSLGYDREAPKEYRHDQSYLMRFWDDVLGISAMGKVVSYKWASHDEVEMASIVQFHGRTKPHHVPNDPIVKKLMALKITKPNLGRYVPITPDGELGKYIECYATRRYGADPRKASQIRLPELSLVGPGDSYLDVGCGRGENLAHVKSIQPTASVRGTEMVPQLQGEFVQDARLPELAGVEPADFVSCYEVLEHLPTHDVIPAIDRLVELSRKILVLSTNDMPSKSFDGTVPLHLSRFPQIWWLKRLEEICMKRGGALSFRPQRPIVNRPDMNERRFWMFMLDFRNGYVPFNWAKCHFHGYDSDMTDLWFWYCPAFPVSELLKTPESTQFELPHVQALHKDLDARGILNPLLVHNIPGQTTRRYWVRCGNHRRNWAIARGIKTVPAIVYGGCEFEPCTPVTMRDANRRIRDGRLSFVANQPPNVVDVHPWDTTLDFYAPVSEYPDPRINYMHVTHEVRKVDGTDQPYAVWYIENFPIDKLKYTPLEDVEGETPRRLALAADIEKRGLINPLIVWNHNPSSQRDSPRPYYLHFGYNKLWALKHLGRTHARAFLTLDHGRAPEFPCMGCPSPKSMIDHFGDGVLVLGRNGPVFKEVTSLVRWEFPA